MWPTESEDSSRVIRNDGDEDEIVALANERPRETLERLFDRHSCVGLHPRVSADPGLHGQGKHYFEGKICEDLEILKVTAPRTEELSRFRTSTHNSIE